MCDPLALGFLGSAFLSNVQANQAEDRQMAVQKENKRQYEETKKIAEEDKIKARRTLKFNDPTKPARQPNPNDLFANPGQPQQAAATLAPAPTATPTLGVGSQFFNQGI